MKKYHIVEDVAVSTEGISLRVDGKKYDFKLSAVSRKLQKATPAERATYEVSPSGYGIHWPLLDEDLSIDGLINSNHKPVHVRFKQPVPTH